MDIMLPKLDGIEVLERMRSWNIRVPIIMLTARDAIPDIVHGLDLGADDYLTKPFDFTVMLARVRALVRRPEVLLQIPLRAGDLVLRAETHEVQFRERPSASHLWSSPLWGPSCSASGALSRRKASQP